MKIFIWFALINLFLQLTFCLDTYVKNCLIKQCSNDKECPELYNCDFNLKICVHKGLFPLTFMESIGIIGMGIISMVATSVGIGGGITYSTILMIISNFPLQIAFPMANFIILFCSILTFYLGVKDKEQNPEQNFVNFYLALLFCPTMLLGTKLGVIFNNIIPGIYLLLILAVLLLFSLFKVYKNAQKTRAIEDAFSEKPINKNILIDKGPLVEQITPIVNISTESVIDWEKIKLMSYIQILVIFDSLIEGNSKVSSIIGIRKCSLIYWIIFISFSILLVYFVIYFIDKYKEIEVGISNSSKEQLSSKFKLIVIGSFFAGIVSSMLGMGGGLILNPLMLELNVPAKSTTSTSNLMIIFSSFTGTILFLMTGQINLSYGIPLSIICTVFAYFGATELNKYIKRTNKSSILLYILFYIQVSSLIVLPFYGITNASYEKEKGLDIFEFKKFCP